MNLQHKLKIPENLIPVLTRINARKTELKIKFEGNVIDVNKSKLSYVDLAKSLSNCRIPFIEYSDSGMGTTRK